MTVAVTATDPSETFLRALRAGEEQAVAELVDGFWAPSYRLALRMCRGDAAAAEDVAQEALINALRGVGELGPNRSFRPWLFRIARNVCFDALKKASARHERAQEPAVLSGLAGGDPQPGPAEVASGRETAGILREVTLALPRQELAVFLLKHDQGLTYEEVAEALACSVRTAKYRMRAALERIGREAERRGVLG